MVEWISSLVAASGAVAVAVIAATLTDRLTLRRLERVDVLLRDTTMTGEHQQLLEAVRERLVERIAYRELRPALKRYRSLAAVLIVSGIAILIGAVIDALEHARGDEGALNPWQDAVMLAMGAGFLLFATHLLASISAERQIWAEQTLPSLRADVAVTASGADEDASS